MHNGRLLAALGLLAAPVVAEASFHFMQIEKVAGSVDGSPVRQAVQLRMRSGGQNQLTNTRVRVYDANGANPVTLIVFPGVVPTATAGARILLVSPQFETQPAITADFVMSNIIPESYLDAGRVTFEDSGGNIYWSVCWGGASYLGATTGLTTNDSDGNFGPCVSQRLRIDNEAVQFNGAANALSTNNQADYSALATAGSFSSNAGNTGTAVFDRLFGNSFED